MGPGTQPLTIAKELVRRGHRVLFASSGGAYMPEVRKAGFRVEVIPTLAHDKHDPISTCINIAKLARLVRTEQIDVIHGHNAAATICAWIGGRIAGCRPVCVTSVRGVEERSSHNWRNQVFRLVPGTLLAVCENGKRRLTEFGVLAQRVVVTYNGVDTTIFDPQRVDGSKRRQEFGLTGCLVVGCVGALIGDMSWGGPGKGQHLLVHAVSRLRAKYPTLRALIVGDGPMRVFTEDLAGELGVRDRIVFAGRRFDVPELLAAMDIYCLPSTYGEFFPNSILEAMAMAKPWVGSDIAGLPELTADDEAGWTVPVGNIDALVAKLDTLLNDQQLRQDRGARARKEVMTKFTVQLVVDRIERAYRTARV
jgi:glycosyltransferase involved in cell wall biosynthesis